MGSYSAANLFYDLTSSLRNLPDRRIKSRGVDDRPDVDDPAEQDPPENGRQHELDERCQRPALQQLSQARDEEAA